MDRYSRIINKNKREIVLLQAFPCAWGKCSFCDYIDDNSKEEAAMNRLNKEVLQKVTGEYAVLEVINSGSCFELPKETLEEIKRVIREKGIQKLYFESHWMYRNRLDQMREFMDIPILYKIGVETFDFTFREEYLNKHADFHSPEEVKKYFDSPCLMVGIQGQTQKMIQRDIELLKTHFSLGTINIYTNNSTAVKKDEALVKWFLNEYKDLELDSRYEILYENTDFGVGD